MLPYAALGFLCSYYGIFERLRQNKTIALIMSGTFLLILLRMALLPTAAGFGYSVGNCIPLVFFLVVFSYFLPLEHLPTALKSMLSFCTRYTLGIYCMHMLAGRLLDALLHACNINLNRFLFCITVYEVCFVFSFCIAGLGRISKKKPVRIFTHLVE